MQNYTLLIVWANGTPTALPFATRQLAMAALDDIRVTAMLQYPADDSRTLAMLIQSAVILANAPEAIEPTRRAKS